MNNIQTISQQLKTIAMSMGVKYSLKNKPLTYEEVFSETGLLPGLTKRADQLCSLCLGYGIGAKFEKTEGAVLGTKVDLDDTTPNSLRYLCFIDVLYEMIRLAKNADPVPLDDLLYD